MALWSFLFLNITRTKNVIFKPLACSIRCSSSTVMTIKENLVVDRKFWKMFHRHVCTHDHTCTAQIDLMVRIPLISKIYM